jgi:hypothetical protein
MATCSILYAGSQRHSRRLVLRNGEGAAVIRR